MKKQKEVEEVKVPKQPRTIKVKTVVLIVLWTVSVIVSLYAGWSLKTNDTERVHNEAKVMLNSLIETAQNTKVSK